MLTEVFILTKFDATHHWPGCPFEDVAYLRDPHRHLFHVQVACKVSHDDRDIEFIRLKKAVDSFITKMWRGKFVGAMSCEMMAKDLMNFVNRLFGRQIVTMVEVSEDGENGARIQISRPESGEG